MSGGRGSGIHHRLFASGDLVLFWGVQADFQDAKWESSTLAMKFAGVLISIVSGLCGASILLPMVLRSQSPESLLPAFGAGTLLTATVIWIGAMAVSKFLGRSVDAISKIPDIRLQRYFMSC